MEQSYRSGKKHCRLTVSRSFLAVGNRLFFSFSSRFPNNCRSFLASSSYTVLCIFVLLRISYLSFHVKASVFCIFHRNMHISIASTLETLLLHTFYRLSRVFSFLFSPFFSNPPKRSMVWRHIYRDDKAACTNRAVSLHRIYVFQTLQPI